MKMQMLLVLLLTIGGCAPVHSPPISDNGSLSGGNPDPVAPPPEAAPPSGPGNPKPENFVGWAAVSTRVVSTCRSCHGSGYTTYNGAKANHALMAKFINTDRMPPRRPLGACPKAIFSAWERAGMPQTSTAPIQDLPECRNGILQKVMDEWIVDLPLNHDF